MSNTICLLLIQYNSGNKASSLFFFSSLLPFAVSTEAFERESGNPSVLGELSSDNKSMSAAERTRKRVKPEPKENFQNWLSEDAAKNMFQDEPNQCANQ